METFADAVRQSDNQYVKYDDYCIPHSFLCVFVVRHYCVLCTPRGTGAYSVRERQHARHEATAAQSSAAGATTAGKSNTGTKEKKLGYVPREKAQLLATGLTSGGMMSKQTLFPDASQELDEASASRLERVKQTDADIDDSVEQLARTIDNLSHIAGAMGAEARHQNAKIGKIDKKLTHVNEKQIVVNARMKSLLKHS